MSSNGINPLARWLIGGSAVLVVVAVVYGIMTSGIHLPPATETASTQSEDSINPQQLKEEAAPTPAASVLADPVAVVEQRTQASPAPSFSPKAQATPDAILQWRLQKRLKVFAAPVMIAAFASSDRQVREIPPHGGIDGIQNQTKLHPPSSPFTIMAGSHISAALITGVDSNYPGTLTAQVDRPLYDSATGRYVLIPPGSKVIGSFQRPSGPLQDRVAVSWHRLIFPDTSSLDLPDVPATDAQGYAALTGEVDSHYGATFGAALLTSSLSIVPTIASTLAFNNSAQVSPFTGGVYHDQVNQQVPAR